MEKKVRESQVIVENCSIHERRPRADVNRNQCHISSLIADTSQVVIDGILLKDVVRILEGKSFNSLNGLGILQGL